MQNTRHLICQLMLVHLKEEISNMFLLEMFLLEIQMVRKKRRVKGCRGSDRCRVEMEMELYCTAIIVRRTVPYQSMKNIGFATHVMKLWGR